jgi:hypothetical protein
MKNRKNSKGLFKRKIKRRPGQRRLIRVWILSSL